MKIPRNSDMNFFVQMSKWSLYNIKPVAIAPGLNLGFRVGKSAGRFKGTPEDFYGQFTKLAPLAH